MSRKSGIGSLVITAAKMSLKHAAKQAREQEKIRRKELKAHERLTKKNEIIEEKSRKKAEQENEKYIFNNLTNETIQRFGLGKFEHKKTEYVFDSNLDSAINLVKDQKGNDFFSSSKKIKISDIDQFLLSGKFNSVLGLNGFKAFKDQLKKIVESVNSQSNKANFINLDALYEVLLHSGVYYESNFLPEEMKYLDKDEGWLTAYRFISKNFSDITYKDFRAIVKNLSKTVGDTIEFDQNEKGSNLYEKISTSSLFVADSSANSILSTLSMAELRAICADLDVQGARSKEETILILISSQGISKTLSEKYSHKNEGLVFIIKDNDLVKAKDIAHLDRYLRELAKNVRDDLFDFVENKINYKLVG